MPRTTNLLTISLSKSLLGRMRSEAQRRSTTVSALLRDAFEVYTKQQPVVYTDQELKALLKADRLPPGLKRDLDRLLA